MAGIDVRVSVSHMVLRQEVKMKNNNDIHMLVRNITLAHDERALETIFATLSPGNISKPVRVAFVNAHGINLCFSDSAFLNHLLEAEHLFRDGSGMKILYKMLGIDPGLNLNGTDLIPRIIDRYAGHDVALLGTQDPYLSRAAHAIEQKGLTPVLTMDGFQKDEAYLEAARTHRVPLIILAMGMPKQERIASLLAKNLDYPCLIVCGGAILDFIGGKVTRAPLIFRQIGMEWLYRLALEPRRLFRRYVIGNFTFLFRSCNLAANRESAKSFSRN